MRLTFMGTPDFAATTLRALIADGHEIMCVYSQPPRPAGRGYELKKSPVHLLAEECGIEVRTPASLKSAEEQAKFVALKADAAVVVAYGLLLPKPVLDAPKFGCFNVHASLLPRWRGAAPIQRAIMAGDAESGVTIMRMDEGLDTGPMMKIVKTPIAATTTAASLHDELAHIGAAAMVDVLRSPDAVATSQPAEGITYAKKIDKAEARIDFGKPADDVRNHIHGLSPFPGAWTTINNARIKVLKAEASARQGEAATFLDDALTIACGTGALRLVELQREGKGAMSAETFLRGFKVPAGTKAI
jgi:methionyl-tRNA formyltransferase